MNIDGLTDIIACTLKVGWSVQQ